MLSGEASNVVPVFLHCRAHDLKIMRYSTIEHVHRNLEVPKQHRHLLFRDVETIDTVEKRSHIALFKERWLPVLVRKRAAPGQSRFNKQHARPQKAPVG